MSDDKFPRTKPHINVGTIGHANHGKHLMLMRALAMSAQCMTVPVTRVLEMDAEHERGITIKSGDADLELITDMTIRQVVQRLEEEGYEAEEIDGEIYLRKPNLKEGLEEVVDQIKCKVVDVPKKIAVLGCGFPSIAADVLALSARCAHEPQWELLPSEVFPSGASINPYQNKHSMREMNKRTQHKFRGIQLKQKFMAQKAKRGKK